MATATLTSKGQTTIPKEIRNYLGLKTGDRLEFVIESDGKVVLVPVTLDVADLQGVLPAPKRPVTIEEMEQAIQEGATRSVRD